jgi:hypothetical protein
MVKTLETDFKVRNSVTNLLMNKIGKLHRSRHRFANRQVFNGGLSEKRKENLGND